MKKPRPYQMEAFRSAYEILDTPGERCLVHLATGLGKTFIASMVAAEYLGRRRKVLFLAAAREIVQQNAADVEALSGVKPDIEMGSQTSPDTLYQRSDLVVGTIQSMTQRRRMRYRQDEFDLVIIDEAHHSVAPSYRSLLEYFNTASVLGLTATPRRGDKVALGNVFNHTAYSMDILDGVQQGWLVGPFGKRVPLSGLDLSKSRKVAGDIPASQIGLAIDAGDDALAEMCLRTIEHAGDRRTLVFAPTVRHAHLAASIINERLGQRDIAAAVDGKTAPEPREEIFRRFGAGEHKYLVQVGVAMEGWDDPATDGMGVRCISIMRPTLSVSNYIQMIGRGTRTVPGLLSGMEESEDRERLDAIAVSPKPDLMVLDMTPQAGRHRIVTTEDALNGKPLDAEESELANAAAARGERMDASKLEQIREQAEENRKQRAARLAQENAQPAKLFANADLNPTHASRFDLFSSDRHKRERAKRNIHFARGKAIKPGQLKLITEHNLLPEGEARKLTIGQAHDIILDHFEASKAQYNYAKSLGIDTAGMRVTKWEMGRLIKAARQGEYRV